jgi:succinyl-CoA synthetase alpha subunit
MQRLGYDVFTSSTRAIVHGYQTAAVQRMLDFDHVVGRATPSVAAIVNPARAGQHLAFFGAAPVAIPMYRRVAAAVRSHPEADVLINFASMRSAHGVTMEALDHGALRTIVVVAEGVAERKARELAARARSQGVLVIGPATVGGIKAGAFRIGNSGGTIENIIEAKLHRPGHVAYVSRSGGMSNELNNIIARASDGVYEGIAVGGDRFLGSAYLDHLLRYEADPAVGMMVLLGEIGGRDEYEVAGALRQGRLTKPLVAWCIGTSARLFQGGVQFGHAGARADADSESAEAKNAALRDAGAIVPQSFEGFDAAIRDVYDALVAAGRISPAVDVAPRSLPEDFASAARDGRVRRTPSFVTTVSDDRGDELVYGGLPLAEAIERGLGVGGVIGLLWFGKVLPPWACRFIELCLQITADHGPAVSAAHNTIVAARAGKDLVASVASGLLTIGPRFGGAVDGAARAFGGALARGLTAEQFVEEMRSQGEPIPGIGHLVRSLTSPDARVVQLDGYARRHFRSLRHLEYARSVERITTQKRNNLILNVDGCIGALFLDLMESTGAFSPDEIQAVVDAGVLNGLFVLGRTIGLVGHFMDQRRLHQPLYRHPWDDIVYALPEQRDPGQHDASEGEGPRQES